MFGRTEKRTIAVEGMTCGHCEQRVEKVVSQIPGVKKVKASHASQSVEISYKKDTLLNAPAVEKAIAEVGFKVMEKE
jgi:copper ion binding protein